MQEIKIISNKKKFNINDYVAIIAYISIIGTIIAIFLHNKNTRSEKSFVAFHLRQALGLYLYATAVLILILILSFFLGIFSISLLTALLYELAVIALLVLAIQGIINAAGKKRKELFFIGASIENFFGKTFE